LTPRIYFIDPLKLN